MGEVSTIGVGALRPDGTHNEAAFFDPVPTHLHKMLAQPGQPHRWGCPQLRNADVVRIILIMRTRRAAPPRRLRSCAHSGAAGLAAGSDYEMSVRYCLRARIEWMISSVPSSRSTPPAREDGHECRTPGAARVAGSPHPVALRRPQCWPREWTPREQCRACALRAGPSRGRPLSHCSTDRFGAIQVLAISALHQRGNLFVGESHRPASTRQEAFRLLSGRSAPMPACVGPRLSWWRSWSTWL